MYKLTNMKIWYFERGFDIMTAMTIENYIEHTILKPAATTAEAKKVIEEAIDNGFYGVCVSPNFVELARNTITLSTKNHKPKVVSVVNFPFAMNKIETTVFQTKQAISDGADEIDTVINLSALKDKDYGKVESDVRETKKACGTKVLKVILETDLLTKEEIEAACKICVEAGANFVKTSTGMLKDSVGATVENVELMYKTVSPFGLNVKASGGVKTRKDAEALINAGAARIGTSKGMDII